MDLAEEFDDPTIRDKSENGYVFTRPRYLRLRRTLKVNYERCTGLDRATLISFVQVLGGWNAFLFTDNRVTNMAPGVLTVRFTKLPTITDDGWIGGEKRFKFAFEVTEQ